MTKEEIAKIKKREANRRYYLQRKAESKVSEADPAENETASPTLKLVTKTEDAETLAGPMPVNSGCQFDPDSVIQCAEIPALNSDLILPEQEFRVGEAELAKSALNSVTTENSASSSPRQRKFSAACWLKILLTVGLSGVITCCLVNEAYRYYAQHDQSMAMLKALLGELILLYLALLSPTRPMHWLLVRGLMLAAFGYLIWVISMGLLLSASGEVNKVTQTKIMIGEIERQIDDKRSKLGELTKSGWVSRARKIDEQITGYHDRLFELRTNFANMGNDRRDLIIANMISLIFFRVILMLTNILAMGRLRGLITG